MTETAAAPEPSPRRPEPPSRARIRRRRVWRAVVVVLVLGLAYALYGGRLGGPSAPAEVRGELQRLSYPSSLGKARVRRLGASLERVQIGGFGEPKKRGPAAAMEALWQMTRAGGLLFEVRGIASDAERDYLLQQKPYACREHGETTLVGEVAGVQVRRAQRLLLFRWLPTPVSLCGSAVRDAVLIHASGFATEGTWVREGPQLLTMLRDWEVDRDDVPTEAHGCRLHTEHEPALYVQFKSEALAEQGLVREDTIHWIDLPYQGEGSVGRFTPAQLHEVSADCAREQARFSKLVDAGASPQSVEAQDAQHAFMARCEPLFPTLRFLGAEELRPEHLPRPMSGWTLQLDAAQYAPAICLPVEAG